MEAHPFRRLQSANGRDDGAQLFTNLTGVAKTRCDEMLQSKDSRLMNASKTRSRSLCSRLRCLANSSLDGPPESPGRKNVRDCKAAAVLHKAEKNVDTRDLRFWSNANASMGDDAESTESSSMNYVSEDNLSDASDERKARAVENVRRKKSLSSEEYVSRLKDSIGFLQLRTKLLQDLTSDSRDDSPTSERKSILEKQRKPDNDAPSTSSRTSISVKRARKLAGLIHVEEQGIDLRDVYQWLQHLGKLSAEDHNVDSAILPLKGDAEAVSRGSTVNNADYEIYKVSSGSSTALITLQQAQVDVSNRLADLYEEKNMVVCCQAEVFAKKMLTTQVGDSKEEKFQRYIERLQHMEEGYELLGTAITGVIQEAERLEEELCTLHHDLKASGISIINQEKARQNTDQERKKVAGTDQGGASSVDASIPQTMYQETTGIFHGSSSLFAGRQSQISTSVTSQDHLDVMQEKPKIGKLSSPYREIINQSAQTEEVLILPLKKLQKQLHFWRSKNWREKYEMQTQAIPAPAYTLFNQFVCGDTSLDIALLFYYNPQTGLYNVITASDLEPSVHQAILDLATRTSVTGAKSS